jgi:hypothetical protein
MDAPKPYRPTKRMMPQPQPSEKRVYTGTRHLEHKPFEGLNERLADKDIRRGEKS